jgi:hypothetical protein
MRFFPLAVACAAASLLGAELGGCSSSSSSSPLSCSQTVDAFCAQPPGCLSFQDAVTHCTAAQKVTSSPCSGYLVIQTLTPDSNQLSYYDATTGKLVAVVFNGESCVAGPSSFTIPSCTADAPCSGADGGAPDAMADASGG